MSLPKSDSPTTFALTPLQQVHMTEIASWYEDINELALIESKLPLPVNSETLEKLWERDLNPATPRLSYVYAILNSSNRIVGFVGLQEINYNYGNAVAFVFVEKSLRRKGVALRAFGLILDLAFLQLRLHRVGTYIHANNQPSIELIKRLGFKDEGLLREACFFNGCYEDVNIVGQLAEEWHHHRTELQKEMSDNITIHFGKESSQRWCWPCAE